MVFKRQRTTVEAQLASAMRRAGIRFTSNANGFAGRPDFVLPGAERHLAVFVNGRPQTKRQAAARRRLRRLGLATMTVNELSIAVDPDAVAARIGRRAGQ
jgi:G:T-mismatch repair DNA endonuclease (very short patch repair protein)